MRFVQLTISLLFLFALTTVQAQENDRKDYALLWEISGNGLTESSFLFGSMHIRENLAFEFPDSLLIYLTQCDAFANEVHLDSAMHRLFEVQLGGQELKTDSSYIEFIKTKSVKKTSSSPPITNIWEEISEPASDEDIDIEEIEEEIILEEGHQATMLDAYLMNIANGLGKELYGLEKIDNHFYESTPNLDLSSAFSVFNHSYEDLKKQYYNGDLVEIQKIIEKEAVSFDNLELIPRNYIMVESMLPIMAKQRLFSVVGAAHLPGKEGVIELLKDKGYTLRRVTPSFSNERNDIVLNEKILKKRNWSKINAQGERFELSTPLPYHYTSISPFESTYLQADVGKGLFYLLLTSSLSPYEYDDFDEYFFTNDGYEIKNKVPFELNDIQGHRYKLFKIGEEVEHYIGYVFIKNGQLYYLQIGAYEEETLENAPDVTHFTQSFHVLEAPSHKWQNHKDSIAAFSVSLPRHFTMRSNNPLVSGENFNSATYTAGFDGTQSSVWLKYTDIPIEEQKTTDSLELIVKINEIEEEFGVDLTIKELENSKMHFEGSYEEKNLLINGWAQARGNRVYCLFTIDKPYAPNTKRFLKSFKFTPYQDDNTTKSILLDSLFQCHIPSSESVISTNTQPTNQSSVWAKQITATDKNSGAFYKIIIEKLHPLSGTNDTLGFLTDKLERDSFISGQFIENYTFTQNNFPQIITSFSPENKHYAIKKQVYVSGEYLISKEVYADVDYFDQPTSERFFNDDKWNRNSSHSPSLFVGKGDTILSLLNLQDSSQWLLLSNIIQPEFTFNISHQTNLRKVLLGTKWSHSTSSLLLQRKILSSLVALSSENSLDLLENLFTESLEGSPLRITVLSTLLSDTEHVGVFFSLLRNDKTLSHFAPKALFSPFYSNPKLLNSGLEQLIAVLENNEEHPVLWDVVYQIYKDNTADMPKSLRYSLIERGKRYIDKFSAEQQTLDQQNTANSVFQTLQLFPQNPTVTSLVERLINRKKNDQLSVNAVDFIIKNGGDVSSAKLKQLLNNTDTYFPIIEVLNSHNRLSDLKSKYYDQSKIAEGLLRKQLVTDGILASDIIADSNQPTLLLDDKRFYLFTFTLNDKPSRLAIVGIFSDDSNERRFVDENNINYTDYPVTKIRRERKAKALAEELIE